MKAKTLLFCILISMALVFITGCATSVSVVNNNEIRSKYVEINPIIERDQYIILQKVTGSSEYITIEKNQIVGDSKKYGAIKQQVIEEPVKRSKKDINIAIETARSNALYQVIQKTNEIGGDTIIEPLEQIETKIETKAHKDKYYYKVTITALAVQLKRN